MTQNEWKNIFANNLFGILRERGISQSQLSKDSGVSISRISDYINERAVPSIFNAINIAYALDMEVNELIDFDERVY